MDEYVTDGELSAAESRLDGRIDDTNERVEALEKELERVKGLIKQMIEAINTCTDVNKKQIDLDFKNITGRGVSPDTPATMQNTSKADETLINTLKTIAAQL